jgi:hypothetical protein
LIPYYAWANRGATEMAVWLARDASKARVARAPGLAARAKVSASEQAAYPQRVNDQYEPEGSDDSTGFMYWPPAGPEKAGTAAEPRRWIEYRFDSPVTVSEASVYWYDDTGGGNIRVPASWRLLYRSGTGWVPVPVTGPAAGAAKDRWNTITFAPINAAALRLDIEPQKGYAVGVHEWAVK